MSLRVGSGVEIMLRGRVKPEQFRTPRVSNGATLDVPHQTISATPTPWAWWLVSQCPPGPARRCSNRRYGPAAGLSPRCLMRAQRPSGPHDALSHRVLVRRGVAGRTARRRRRGTPQWQHRRIAMWTGGLPASFAWLLATWDEDRPVVVMDGTISHTDRVMEAQGHLPTQFRIPWPADPTRGIVTFTGRVFHRSTLCPGYQQGLRNSARSGSEGAVVQNVSAAEARARGKGVCNRCWV